MVYLYETLTSLSYFLHGACDAAKWKDKLWDLPSGKTLCKQAQESLCLMKCGGNFGHWPQNILFSARIVMVIIKQNLYA